MLRTFLYMTQIHTKRSEPTLHTHHQPSKATVVPSQLATKTNAQLWPIVETICGVLILGICGPILYLQTQRDFSSDWPSIVTIVILAAIYLPIGLTLILAPARKLPVIQKLASFILWPVERLLDAGYYYMLLVIPFLLLVLMVMIGLFIWYLILRYGQVVEIASNALFYTISLASLSIFVYCGRWLVERVLAFQLKHYSKANYHRNAWWLGTPALRLVVYSVQVVLLVFSTFERLSGRTFIENEVWLAYKDTSLEVFVSFAAIDYVAEKIEQLRPSKNSSSSKN